MVRLPESKIGHGWKQLLLKAHRSAAYIWPETRWSKGLGNDDLAILYEIRSKVSSNIQQALYFHVVEENYLITNGFTKKTQKTPQREIEHAKRIKEEYLKELDKHENN